MEVRFPTAGNTFSVAKSGRVPAGRRINTILCGRSVGKGGGESTLFPLAFNTSSFSLSCVEYLDLPFPYPQVYQIALDVIGVTY